MKELLKVEKLTISFADRKVVEDVSFSVYEGEILGIVGESGSGKTITSLSVIRMTPESAKVDGSIIFDGKDIMNLPEDEIRKIRGKEISLITQNPHSAFNPVFKVGYQVVEPMLIHYGVSPKKAKKQAIEVFGKLGISEPEMRLNSYPHELSGGMKQRAVISISILTGSKLIIADEPTTALDPTIASQILKLLRNLVEETKKSIIFISHDISAVGWISDRIAVMYGGWIVEIGKSKDILNKPFHPYTRALIEAIPGRKVKPKPIPGSPLDINWKGCRFAKRCEFARTDCFEKNIDVKTLNSRTVRCIYPLIQ